jgi:hypothetical protein
LWIYKADAQGLSSGFENFFERTTLNNKEFDDARSWIHVFMVAVYTFLTIAAVQKTRRDARISYQHH